MVNQLSKTIDIIEEAIDELIDMRDNWFPVGSGFSDELSDFTEDELSKLIDRIMNKKRWKDSIGQSI